MKLILLNIKNKIILFLKRKYRRIRYGPYHPNEIINASFSAFNAHSNSFMIDKIDNEEIKRIYFEKFHKLSFNGKIDDLLKTAKVNKEILNIGQNFLTYGNYENHFNVHKLKNISIKGKYPLAYYKGKAIGDSVYPNYSRDRLYNQLFFNDLSNSTNLIKDKNIKIKYIDKALILTSKWNHYGHFLTEHIYKIRFLKKSISKKEFNKVKFIVEGNFPNWKKDVLNSLNIDINNLIYWDKNLNFEVKDLYMTSYPLPTYDNLIWLKEEVKKYFNINNNEKNRNKIYISRNKLSTIPRKVSNEKDLIAYLKKNNFLIMHPQMKNFQEQVEIFSNASIIIGPHGSGHINSLFSDDCKVIEFQGNHTRLALFSFYIANLLGHKWELLIYEENQNNGSIKVDIDQLDSLLKKLQK